MEGSDTEMWWGHKRFIFKESLKRNLGNKSGYTGNSLLGICFTLPLHKVHSKYRRTGASFNKAQQEFSQGVFTNSTFQSAAAGAASSAAQGAFQRN